MAFRRDTDSASGAGDTSAADETRDPAVDLDDDEYEDDEYDDGPDPLVPWLSRLAFMIIALLLVTLLMFVWYALATRSAPRTSVERAIARWEAAVEREPESSSSWAQLAYAYADAGRHNEALSTVRRAREVSDAVILDIAEADVLRIAGRLEEALEAYGRAESNAKRAHDDMRQELEDRGIMSIQPNTALMQVLVGRARTQMKLGEYDAARTDLEEAARIVTNSAVIFTLLGEVNEELGDAEAAERAYREALRFVPDHQPALAGLERLGVDE